MLPHKTFCHLEIKLLKNYHIYSLRKYHRVAAVAFPGIRASFFNGGFCSFFAILKMFTICYQLWNVKWRMKPWFQLHEDWCKKNDTTLIITTSHSPPFFLFVAMSQPIHHNIPIAFSFTIVTQPKTHIKYKMAKYIIQQNKECSKWDTHN